MSYRTHADPYKDLNDQISELTEKNKRLETKLSNKKSEKWKNRFDAVLDFITNNFFLWFVLIVLGLCLYAIKTTTTQSVIQTNATHQAELYVRNNVRLPMPYRIICSKEQSSFCHGDWHRLCELHSNPTPTTHSVFSMCCSGSSENNPGCVAVPRNN